MGTESGVAVSLTSYGGRTVHSALTIESIASGSVLPGRLLIWLDPEDFRRPPPSLRLLADRGLEIREANANWGPHKKYFPYCQEFGDQGSLLVTADDDVFYPRNWLADLTRASRQSPDTIIAHRARVIGHTSDTLKPYSQWRLASDVRASMKNIAVGVAGVAYPSRMQGILARAGENFMHVAPRADDLWLHAQEVRNQMPTAQLAPHAADYPLQPGSQSEALADHNQMSSGNDFVISKLYTASDLALIMSNG